MDDISTVWMVARTRHSIPGYEYKTTNLVPHAYVLFVTIITFVKVQKLSVTCF